MDKTPKIWSLPEIAQNMKERKMRNIDVIDSAFMRSIKKKWYDFENGPGYDFEEEYSLPDKKMRLIARREMLFEFLLSDIPEVFLDQNDIIGQQISLSGVVSAVLEKVGIIPDSELEDHIEKAMVDISGYPKFDIASEKLKLAERTEASISQAAFPLAVRSLLLSQEAFEMGRIGGPKPPLPLFPPSMNSHNHYIVQFIEGLPNTMSLDGKANLLSMFSNLLELELSYPAALTALHNIARQLLHEFRPSSQKTICLETLTLLSDKEDAIERMRGTFFELPLKSALRRVV